MLTLCAKFCALIIIVLTFLALWILLCENKFNVKAPSDALGFLSVNVKKGKSFSINSSDSNTSRDPDSVVFPID